MYLFYSNTPNDGEKSPKHIVIVIIKLTDLLFLLDVTRLIRVIKNPRLLCDGKKRVSTGNIL
jgi:hypothetical protein